MQRINTSHLVLSPRSFGSLSMTFFMSGIISFGYDLVDQACIAPYGVNMVAGFALGNLIVALYTVFFHGAVDVYAIHWAKAAGVEQSKRVYTQLVCGFYLAIIPLTIVAVMCGVISPWLLTILGSQSENIAIAQGAIMVHMCGITCCLILAAKLASLRILGRKSCSTLIVLMGFFLNAGLDMLALHSPLSDIFSTPVIAVSVCTIAVQGILAIVSLIIERRVVIRKEITLRSQNSTMGDTEHMFEWPEVFPSIFGVMRAILRGTIGAGMRHMNDYAASVIPFILISRSDVSITAAAAVAISIWTLYCRVPQAALSAASVFIAYARGQDQKKEYGEDKEYWEDKIQGHLIIRYVAIPSLICVVVILPIIPVLGRIFGGSQVDQNLVWVLSCAYLCSVPAYILENLGGEILTIENCNAWLAIPSTLVTYLINIPFALIGVVEFHSVICAVLSAAVASVILTLIYGTKLFRMGYRLWSR